MTQWEIVYENEGNEHFREWLAIKAGWQTIAITPPKHKLTDDDRANAHLLQVAPELLAACEMVIKAAIDNNPPRYLDEFIAEGMGRLNVCLTPAELTQLKDALARAD